MKSIFGHYRVCKIWHFTCPLKFFLPAQQSLCTKGESSFNNTMDKILPPRIRITMASMVIALPSRRNMSSEFPNSDLTENSFPTLLLVSLLQWKRMSSCGASLYLVAHTKPCSFTEMTVTKIWKPTGAFLYTSVDGLSSPKWKASCLHYLSGMFGYSWFSFHM